MRELKIFLVLVVFTGIVYWGVEPYAHSTMHAHTSDANFNFKIGDKEQAKLSNDEALIEATDKMWANVDKIAALKGDFVAGKDDFGTYCASCHRVSYDEIADADDGIGAQGIVIPDLSTAGAIYDNKFLMAISINPALAMKNNKKFNEENPHPMMTSFLEDDGSISEENAQAVANIVAYLENIGQRALTYQQEQFANEVNASKMSDDEKAAAIKLNNQRIVFNDACGRCHDVKYDKNIANINAGDFIEYMGSIAPDLSIIIRAKGESYLNKFINDTQKELPGTAMPRVGLNEKAQKEVISYLTSVGDSKKEEREDLGIKIMIYFAILAVLAYGWKSAIWKELH